MIERWMNDICDIRAKVKKKRDNFVKLVLQINVSKYKI